MHTVEPACPQCAAPLRRVHDARLDCARCGAAVLLDGAPPERGGYVLFGVLVALVSLVSGSLVVTGLVMFGLTARTTPTPTPTPTPVPQVRIVDPWAPSAVPQVPQVPAIPSMQPEPDFLEDPEAMAALPGRIEAVVGAPFTGRFKFLNVDRTPVAVALVETGPQAVDSVVFSWGQQIQATVPMDAEEMARLDSELLDVRADQLAAIPALVDRVEAEGPEGVRVESVTLLALGGPPRMQLTLAHPRIELPQREFTLDGTPIETPR